MIARLQASVLGECPAQSVDLSNHQSIASVEYDYEPPN